ncbi:MAG: hypothetical protein AAFY56_20450, partial [Pseudomonadota bacterium]
MLAQQRPDHEPALGRLPSLVAKSLSELNVEPDPIDGLGQADQLVAYVDDLVEPGSEQIARTGLLPLSRSHRCPPRSTHGITSRRSAKRQESAAKS